MPNDAVLALFLIAIFNFVLSVQSHSAILLPSQLHRDSPISSPAICPAPNPNLYYRPIIGILSHPGDGASGRLSNATGTSYIAASYVKFVEAGGARVIPLIYNEPPEKLQKKLNLVNGVLFTGGSAKSGLYLETVRRIFKKVLERNDAGEHFPLYATCLGFELLTMIISKDNNILEEFSALNQASTLQFVEKANIEGTVFQRVSYKNVCHLSATHELAAILFHVDERETHDNGGRFPPDLLKKMSTECLVMQNHRYGISPGKFLANEKLSSFFEILSTCKDEDDKVYVSTVYSRNYPVTGFQWHPEKNTFEWGVPGIPHTEDAIQITQHAANFLVSEARKSFNRPVAQEVLDNLIYNFSPTYAGKDGRGFDEVYIFAQV